MEEHVLGIITQFAHAINDFQIRSPLAEKKRNIMAIGGMVKIARGHVSSALPQVGFVYIAIVSARLTCLDMRMSKICN